VKLLEIVGDPLVISMLRKLIAAGKTVTLNLMERRYDLTRWHYGVINNIITRQQGIDPVTGRLSNVVHYVVEYTRNGVRHEYKLPQNKLENLTILKIKDRMEWALSDTKPSADEPKE